MGSKKPLGVCPCFDSRGFLIRTPHTLKIVPQVCSNHTSYDRDQSGLAPLSHMRHTASH